jgi:hypothetical protein
MRMVDDTLENEGNFRNFLQQRLLLKAKEIVLTQMKDIDLSSQKISENTRQLTDYNFRFVFVEVKKPSSSSISSMEFNVHGTDYKWVTLEELQNHEQTRVKNGDVLTHFRDHQSKLLIASQLPLSIQEVIA